MKHMRAAVLALTALLVAGTPAWTAEPSAVVVKMSELKWKELGNGVSAAPVSGDMSKGPCRFYLKYPVGMVTPNHHHDADHYVTLVAGDVTLTVEGKTHHLGPGDYFALTQKVPHIAKVEGNEEAVFFIQAEGPWNVVMDK